jgi:hypothetical protein
MKYFLLIVILAIAGFFTFRQMQPKPVPPPPPIPEILQQPAPIISPEEEAKILRSANDQDPSVRWQAMLFLDKMQSPKAPMIFLEKLQKDPDAELRIKILDRLSLRHDVQVTRGVITALKDYEPQVRIAALHALDKIADYSVASAITDILKDQDPSVREEALRTLNSLQDKKAAEIAAAQRHQEELRLQAEQQAKER